jgi:hypothetical protein
MVKFVQRNFFTPIPHVASLEELNQRLRQGCEAYLKQTQSRQVESIETRFKSEQPHFLPLPKFPPECCRIIPVKVSKTSLVQFETNRYSVPSEYAHQTVWLKAFVGHLEITSRDKTVASHTRLNGKYEESICFDHYARVLERNPELNSILKAGKRLPLSLWFLNRRVTPKSVSNLQTLPNTANYSGVFTMIQPQALLLETNLKKLRLPNILKQYRKLASHAAEGNLTHEQFLHLLLDQEVQTREENTLKQRIRQARFPAEKTLSGFEFTAMPNLNDLLLIF